MTFSNDPADPVSALTAGHVARMLEVDLRTVHRWVNLGYIRGRRTLGRHLRFHRPELVRFMRRFGVPIPKELLREQPRVVLAGFRTAELPKIARSCHAGFHASLFEAAMATSSGWYEALVISVDDFEPAQVAELVRSVRNCEWTAGLALLGYSTREKIARRFVDGGGDASVLRLSELHRAIHWLVGGERKPSFLLTSVAEEPERRLRFATASGW